MFLEAGPDAVLTTAGQDCAGDSDEVTFVPVLRSGGPEVDRFLRSLAEVFVRGVPVDWTQATPGTARIVELPTYAFQHKRFWLDGRRGAGDVESLGLGSAGNGLLSVVTGLAESGGVVLSGRIGLGTHAWLADHAVSG